MVAVTYGDLPIKFYTGLRVVGGLTGEDLSPALEAEWIILREHHKVIGLPVHKYLGDHVDFDNYEMEFLDAPDTPFENREEPREHLYRTSSFDGPMTLRPVSVLRRIR